MSLSNTQKVLINAENEFTGKVQPLQTTQTGDLRVSVVHSGDDDGEASAVNQVKIIKNLSTDNTVDDAKGIGKYIADAGGLITENLLSSQIAPRFIPLGEDTNGGVTRGIPLQISSNATIVHTALQAVGLHAKTAGANTFTSLEVNSDKQLLIKRDEKTKITADGTTSNTQTGLQAYTVGGNVRSLLCSDTGDLTVGGTVFVDELTKGVINTAVARSAENVYTYPLADNGANSVALQLDSAKQNSLKTVDQNLEVVLGEVSLIDGGRLKTKDVDVSFIHSDGALSTPATQLIGWTDEATAPYARSIRCSEKGQLHSQLLGLTDIADQTTHQYLKVETNGSLNTNDSGLDKITTGSATVLATDNATLQRVLIMGKTAGSNNLTALECDGDRLRVETELVSGNAQLSGGTKTQEVGVQIYGTTGTQMRTLKCNDTGNLEVLVGSAMLGNDGNDGAGTARTIKTDTNGQLLVVSSGSIQGNDGNDGAGTARTIKTDAEGKLLVVSSGSSPIQGNDGNNGAGTDRTIKTDANGQLLVVSSGSIKGNDGNDGAGTARTIKTDATGVLLVSPVGGGALGDATAANQVLQLARLPVSLGSKSQPNSLSTCRDTTQGEYDLSARTTIGTASSSTRLKCNVGGALATFSNENNYIELGATSIALNSFGATQSLNENYQYIRILFKSATAPNSPLVVFGSNDTTNFFPLYNLDNNNNSYALTFNQINGVGTHYSSFAMEKGVPKTISIFNSDTVGSFSLTNISFMYGY